MEFYKKQTLASSIFFLLKQMKNITTAISLTQVIDCICIIVQMTCLIQTFSKTVLSKTFHSSM